MRLPDESYDLNLRMTIQSLFTQADESFLCLSESNVA
jgi:hypothetical protein